MTFQLHWSIYFSILSLGTASIFWQQCSDFGVYIFSCHALHWGKITAFFSLESSCKWVFLTQIFYLFLVNGTFVTFLTLTFLCHASQSDRADIAWIKKIIMICSKLGHELNVNDFWGWILVVASKIKCPWNFLITPHWWQLNLKSSDKAARKVSAETGIDKEINCPSTSIHASIHPSIQSYSNHFSHYFYLKETCVSVMHEMQSMVQCFDFQVSSLSF